MKIKLNLSVSLVGFLLIGTTGFVEGKQMNNEKMLYDFSKPTSSGEWVIVNDGVMGGLSEGGMKRTENNTAVFSGNVSLENYGGFTSTRSRPKDMQLENFEGLRLRVFGDGKKYQLRIRTDNRFDGVAYRYQFDTKASEWITIEVPFKDFVPVFRGRILSDVGPIEPKDIRQIGFLIADKQSGSFKLELDWIKAY